MFRSSRLVRRLVGSATVACSLLLLSGCYHTIIETNLEPGTEIHEAWRPAFIAGLVPATLEVGDQCGSRGIARAETQHSFLNYLVGVVTLGIFTPMDVRVTCAR